MTSFDYLWVLLEPKKEYEPVRNRCLQLWETFTLEKQRRIYRTIRNRKKEHLFVDYNPLEKETFMDSRLMWASTGAVRDEEMIRL